MLLSRRLPSPWRLGLRRLASIRRATDVSRLTEAKLEVAVREDGMLRTEDLRRLVGLEIAAVHVKGFYPLPLCEELSARLLAQETKNWEVQTARGMESSDVQSVATPFNVAQQGGPDAIDAYFAASRRVMRDLRGHEGQRISPLDKLRLELDEAWPTGSRLSKDDCGRPFLAGLPRVMHGPTRWAQGFCHVDDVSPAVPGRGLFSANVYLQTPAVGGAVEIWPVTWRTPEALERHIEIVRLFTDQDEAAQTRLRSLLPRPTEVVVGPGDLLMLCAKRPHAVQGFPFGERVSVQSFVSIEEEGGPMLLDT